MLVYVSQLSMAFETDFCNSRITIVVDKNNRTEPTEDGRRSYQILLLEFVFVGQIDFIPRFPHPLTSSCSHCIVSIVRKIFVDQLFLQHDTKKISKLLVSGQNSGNHNCMSAGQ